MVRCSHMRCRKTAQVGFPGSNRSMCKNHGEPGMVWNPLINCEVDGCTKRRLYNFEGIGKRRFCFDHKEPGMVRRGRFCHGSVDCSVTASYNYPGEYKPVTCKKHSSPGMICFTQRICIAEGCTSTVRCKTRLHCKPHYKSLIESGNSGDSVDSGNSVGLSCPPESKNND